MCFLCFDSSDRAKKNNIYTRIRNGAAEELVGGAQIACTCCRKRIGKGNNNNRVGSRYEEGHGLRTHKQTVRIIHIPV